MQTNLDWKSCLYKIYVYVYNISKILKVGSLVYIYESWNSLYMYERPNTKI